MKAIASLMKDGKDQMAESADVNKEGDIEALVATLLKRARSEGYDLWNFTVQVRKG